jgi:hypothetical protein
METFRTISNKVLKKEKNNDALPDIDKIDTSLGSIDSYVEEDPSVIGWIRDGAPTGQQIVQYMVSLFPFSRWIFSYNVQWLIGDLVAGNYVYLVSSLIPGIDCYQVSLSDWL